MTEDDLYDLLSPLADGRVYPYVVPLGSDGFPQWPLLTSFSRYRLMLPGMFSAGRPNRRCTFRLMYGLKRTTKPGRYGLMPFPAASAFTCRGDQNPGYDTTTHLHRATLEITVIA
jgi:hypothetical protein